MMIKNKISLFIYLSIFIFMSCNTSESKKEQFELLDCKEIISYPLLFSYATDSLKNNLKLKGIKPLTVKQKINYFKTVSVPSVLHDSAFYIFPVNKISFVTSVLIIYLVKEIQVSSFHENDHLVMVIYNNEGRPMDILAKNLQDIYSSTYEVNYTSRNEFVVINTDNEYSPDPESEAENKKNMPVIEPSVIKQFYHIDTIQFKFVLIDRQ